jgi:glyoxylase-like metal-dependent hydrolase (beta-lactamase superfamily II)
MMKTRALKMAGILGLALALCALAASAALAQGLTRIADNVYSYVDEKNDSPQHSYGANAGIVIGQDGVLVVDTLISAKEAKRFLADIKAVTDKPIKYVVNTHYHLDHAQGNSEFVKLGATVISHTIDRDNARQRGEATLKGIAAYGLSESDMEGTTLSVPTLSFSDKMEIDLGGQVVQLIYPKASHTSGSILVWLPDKRVLFTGDILFTDFHPFLAEGDLKSWGKVLDFAQTLGAEKIIPGHGPLSTNRDLKDMKKYLGLFDRQAKRLAAKIKDPDQLAAALKAELPPRALGAFLIKGNFQMRYMKK